MSAFEGMQPEFRHSEVADIPPAHEHQANLGADRNVDLATCGHAPAIVEAAVVDVRGMP